MILIVDDEEDLCRIMEFSLVERGYAVRTVHDGLAGLEAARKLMPALILLDIKMPKMNGFQMLVKIREDPRTRAIPVVVMTSLNEGNGTTDEEWARRLEVSGFVSKPFDPDQAMAIIESVLPQKK